MAPFASVVRQTAAVPDDASRPDAHEALDARRRAVVEAAARLLSTEGPQALSLRRVAAQVGGSTQLVYTLFGGKPGLADALYAEGFRRLGASMRAAVDASGAAEGDPERLVALGRGYRRFALAEPAFFDVMFGRAVPGFTPSRRTRAGGREQTLEQVERAADQCLRAGTLQAPDAVTLARRCWASTHGVSALESAALLGGDDPDGFAERTFALVVDAHRPPGA
jgi:AcrR family transcriptional regulator